MTAVLFSLTQLQTGRAVGQAVVCPEGRYCSIQLVGAPRLERKFATPARWRSIEVELLPGLEAGPLDRQSAVVQFLTGGRADIVVQYVSQEPIEVPPAQLVAALDARLELVR